MDVRSIEFSMLTDEQKFCRFQMFLERFGLVTLDLNLIISLVFTELDEMRSLVAIISPLQVNIVEIHAHEMV